MHWGIDLGGTKIGITAMDSPDQPNPERFMEMSTPRTGYRALVDAISGLVVRAAQEWSLPRPEVIGIGTPGTTDPATGLMKNCNTTALNGRPLHADLERALEAKVFMANDANCFALSQARFGEAKGAKVVFGVIVGTGVGGGLVLNGEAWGGRHGLAGEWGHNCFDPSGHDCYCGRRGCLETLISGTALQRLYASRTGNSKTLPEIMEERSEHTWMIQNHLVQWLGLALGHVVNFLDPDVIVLGGGVSNLPVLYDRLPHEVSKHVFNPTRELRTPILPPSLADHAGVYGAALLPIER